MLRLLQLFFSILFSLYSSLFISISKGGLYSNIFIIFIFSIPLLLQVIKNNFVRIYAIWFGVFMVAQSATPFLFRDYNAYHTLQPNLKRIIDIRAGLPGIEGIQTITTDEMGFRVTKKINYRAKPDDTYRIFAIGGSTTEEIHTDDHLTWTYLLQESLTKKLRRNIEVINAGLGGLRAINHVATLKRVLRFQPDMAIILVGINDWNHEIKKNIHDSGSQSILDFKATPVGVIKNNIENLFNKGRAKNTVSPVANYGNYYTRQRGSLKRGKVITYENQQVSNSYKTDLEMLARLCKENNITCVFLTQPNGYKANIEDEFKNGFWMTPPNEEYTLTFNSMEKLQKKYNDFLLNFCNKNNLYIFDIDKKIKPSYEHLIDECHFNIKGSNKFHSELVSFIIDNNLIHNRGTIVKKTDCELYPCM